MKLDAVYAWGIFAGALPFLAIVLLLVHFVLLRLRWRFNKRLGRRLGYYPSTFALGMALQFLQVFYRPSVAHVVEAKLDEDADEDESGEPETLAKQLHRQLRRIRRGERVDRLVLRL
jgi:hypothetical protein